MTQNNGYIKSSKCAIPHSPAACATFFPFELHLSEKGGSVWYYVRLRVSSHGLQIARLFCSVMILRINYGSGGPRVQIRSRGPKK